jgi:hypothetical protein
MMQSPAMSCTVGPLLAGIALSVSTPTAATFAAGMSGLPIRVLPWGRPRQRWCREKRRREKRRARRANEGQLPSNPEVWGLDPGRTNVFVATNGEPDRPGKVVRYSKANYYAELGSSRTRRRRHKLAGDLEGQLRMLPSCKTASLFDLINYLKAYLPLHH